MSGCKNLCVVFGLNILCLFMHGWYQTAIEKDLSVARTAMQADPTLAADFARVIQAIERPRENHPAGFAMLTTAASRSGIYPPNGKGPNGPGLF
jgi:hypothetical protein